MREVIDPRARIMSDEFSVYDRVGREFLTHDKVHHRSKEYVRGEVHVNTAESSFALLKRGIHGIYHNVSREYLHRYIWQADFLWNGRKLNDGERTVRVMQLAEGKRMRYKE